LKVALGVLALGSVAAIFAAAGTGFVDAYPRQLRKQWFDLLPDPLGQHFAGWVFKAGDLVQVVVIESFVDRLEDGFDFGKVANPAGIRVHFAFDMNGYLERMAMQASTFVSGRDMRQAMGCLKHEFFKQFHGVMLISRCPEQGKVSFYQQ